MDDYAKSVLILWCPLQTESEKDDLDYIFDYLTNGSLMVQRNNFLC